MTHLDSIFGEGNSNPLQCSCLENPRDGEAWWATVYGVAQSWTRLKRLSSSTSRTYSGPVLASSPRMLARKLPRRMSRAAESQSVLMFLALKNGIYGKKDAYKSFMPSRCVRTKKK